MKCKLLTVMAISFLVAPILAYSQVVAGYWRFDQDSGEFPNLKGDSSVAKVMSREHKDSIPVADDPIGEIKKVIELDGLGSEWVSVPAVLKGEDFTIELWIKILENKQDTVFLANGSGIVMGTHRNNSIYFTLAKGGESVTWSYVEVPHAIILDQWLHIAASFSKGNQQLFVITGDDVKASPVVKVDMPKKYNFVSTVVGLNEAGSKKMPFQGRIAALKIYAGVLSEEDLKKSNP